jgi:hypothetical protein
MYRVRATVDKRLREIGLIYKVVRIDFDGLEFPIGYFADRKYAAIVAALLNDMASITPTG